MTLTSAHRRPTVQAAAALLIALFALTASAISQGHAHSWMGDFRAFYCAAHVRLAGADPYSAAPILACESAPAPAPFFVPSTGTALPAPLPGYLVAAFVPLALLPFVLAASLWARLLLAAVIGTIVLLRNLEIGDPWTLLVALSIAVLAVSIPIGELPPVALFGVALTAWSAAHNRPVFLGLGLALAMFEPQIGVAVAIAVAALRWPFALAAGIVLGALLLLSCLTLGIHGNLEYARVVLPAHELSELPAVVQYSLSWVLNRIGVADGPALFLGHLSWIIMLGLTLCVARSSFCRKHPEFAVLAAPAFCVVGGPFLHLDHIALALPAALWLCARVRNQLGWSLAGALCLAVPLLYVFVMMPILGGVTISAIVLVPIVAGWIAAAYTEKAIVGVRVGAAALVVALLVGVALEKTGAGTSTLTHVHGISPRLAQASWSAYVRSHFVYTAWTIWLVKLPTWFGILITAAASLAAVIRQELSTRKAATSG